MVLSRRRSRIGVSTCGALVRFGRARLYPGRHGAALRLLERLQEVEHLKKTVLLGSCQAGDRRARVFVFIEYKDGKLSISGVEGPLKSGNCMGSCGQIIMSMREPDYDFIPADGITPENYERLLQVWDRWHLNDMRPECEHQRAEGWRELAGEKVNLYNWQLIESVTKLRRELERRAVNALKAGEAVQYTAEEQFIANLPYTVKTAENVPPNADYYIASTDVSYRPAVETKALGWLRESEHPRGILCKPCPVCGYKYGSQWKREEVPEDVIEFLRGLPESPTPDGWSH